MRTARRAMLGAASVLAAFLALAPKPWNAATGPGFFATPERSMVETIATASWWAAAANLALVLLLAATARAWAGSSAPPAWPKRSRRRTPAALWAALALAALLGGALRWPLAHGSLWWDEAWMVKRAVVGYREPAGVPPALEFHPVRWHWTVWHYKKPTNHVTYSIASRMSLSAWRLATGAEPWEFSEFALRFPAWLAVFPSLVGLGWLVARASTPAAGAAAAFLLALHPWHLQHTAEARAYSFITLLALAATGLLALSLRSGALRHWGAYAACLALLLWTHPFSAYLALSLAGAAAAGALAGGGSRRDRGRRLLRVAAAHLAAGMLFLQAMAPNLAQVPLWTDVLEPSKGRVVHERSLANLASLAFAGLPLRVGRDEPERDAFPSLRGLARERPWLPGLAFGALPLLALVGLARLAAPAGPQRCAVLGLAAAVPLALALAWAGDLFFHPRFVFFALLPVVAGLAAGLDGLLRAAGLLSPALGRAAVAAGIPLALAGFAALGAPQTRMLLSRPHAPMREAAALAAADPQALRAGYGTGGEMPALYDPWLASIDSAREIEALCARSRAEGRPLRVLYGYPGMNRGRRPDGFRLLDDRALFAPSRTFLGLDPRQVYTVLRYTGEPLP